MRMIFGLFAALLLVGCSSDGPADPDARLAQYALLGTAPVASEYRIGATDLLAITVFQVEELSLKEVRVDAQGNLQFPLIGSIQAAGRTPAELSGDIAAALAERYLRNPQVHVTVTEAASQKVTVDGAVTKPGVYEMQGRTTLLQAVAMAEGPVRGAALDRVVVFRDADGRRMAAAFDLTAIRRGEAEDPIMQGDDVVVIGSSRTQVLLREIITALPALSVFAYIN